MERQPVLQNFIRQEFRKNQGISRFKTDLVIIQILIVRILLPSITIPKYISIVLNKLLSAESYLTLHIN